MSKANPNVDTYLLEGCGRCQFYQTPQCKVHSWTEELIQLRRIALSTELKEEFKWSQPCYTLNGQNVLIVTAFKDYACISFFKGSLLKDEHSILVQPGKSSQAARLLRYTNVEAILKEERQIFDLIQEAIVIEKAGKSVEFKKDLEPRPTELLDAFREDPELETAFESLTQGRQRGYILHFSQPKNSETRTKRIEKCREKILLGQGMNDHYKAMRKK